MSAIAPPTDQSRPASSIRNADVQRSITVEHLCYLLLGVLAAISHLYALDMRALHHDETLHAAYSWRIYQGQGYVHDPLLHGPFLYYITALQYFLFGDSDWTARLSAALFGIAATMLPALLRRELGRGAALLACGYLLISPVFLYVGRFLRHDIYAVTFELISVIALVRYVATERPAWHYTLAAATSLMLTTMETFYLFLLIVGSFVGLWLVWQIARHLVWLCLAYVGALAGALAAGRALVGPIPLPSQQQALEVRNQPDNNIGAYLGNVAGVLAPMLRHPAILASLLLSVAFVAALIYLVFVKRNADGRTAWRRAAETAPLGTLVGALDRIPRRQWLVAFMIAFAIYAISYTALLSNPATPNTAGLITGVSGSLLYWLGQHGVQRGAQPTHYYLFQLGVYEPLLLILGPAGIFLVVSKLWRARRRARATVADATRRYIALHHQRLFAPALLAWWSIGALLVYSWAGEKMPWLTIHMVTPLALLSAWTLAQLWQWTARRPFDRQAALLTAFTGVLLLLVYNRITLLTRPTSGPQPITIWLVLAFIFVVVLVVGLTLNYHSARPALRALLILLGVFGSIATVRNSVRLSFINGDVPVEPMVYVQTAPDVQRVMTQLREASLLRTGRLDLPIRYDNETIWDWYLRNYRETGNSGTTGVTINDDVQAVFLLAENVAPHQEQLDGFVQQTYPLRWWFPECSVYRLPSDAYCSGESTPSLLSRLVQRPWDNATLAEGWRFWFDRTLTAPLGASNWSLFVRPELAREFDIGAGSTQQPATSNQ
jgi:uncharacterized protein (TIGR03663 family)